MDINKIIQNLRKKVEDNNSRMPTIKQIHFLLNHFNIEHEFRETENVVEYRSKGARYVNSRHTGKKGFEIIIKNPYIHLDTSSSYYSWNNYRYAEEILKLLEEKGLLEPSPTSQTSPNGDFSNEKEHNISLKESSNEDSQIPNGTSLNNNIPRLHPNSKICSLAGGNHYE